MNRNHRLSLTFYRFMNRSPLLLSAVASLWGTSAVFFIMSLKTEAVVINDSILSVMVFLGFWYLIRKSLVLVSEKEIGMDVLAGVLFALFLVWGTEIYTRGSLFYSAKGIIVNVILIAGCGILFGTLIIYARYYLPHLAKLMECGRLNRWLSDKKWMRGSNFFILAWIVIFLAWIPAYLGYFPTILAYDVNQQIHEALVHEFSTHHPLIHTLFIGLFLEIGEKVNSYTIGMALYSLVQMLLLSLSFALACRYLIKLKIPPVYRATAVIIFALYPVNPIMSISTTKDVLFAASVLMVFMMLLDLVMFPDQFFSGFKKPIVFLILTVLLSFRNNGIYAFLVVIPFLIFSLKNYRKKVICLCVLAVLLLSGFTKILEISLHATPGSKVEMLSVPLQQMAAAALTGELTNEELETLHEIIAQEDIERYRPYFADIIKNATKDEVLFTDPGKYGKLWVKLGLEHFPTYLNAFLHLNLGCWYPEETYHSNIYSGERNGYLLTGYKELYDPIVIEKKSLWPQAEQIYEKVATESIQQKIPVLSIIFSPGFQFWVLLACILYLLSRKKRRIIVPCTFLFGLWLTLLLSPVTLIRYVYPIMVCLPVLVPLVFKEALNSEDVVSDLIK